MTRIVVTAFGSRWELVHGEQQSFWRQVVQLRPRLAGTQNPDSDTGAEIDDEVGAARAIEIAGCDVNRLERMDRRQCSPIHERPDSPARKLDDDVIASRRRRCRP